MLLKKTKTNQSFQWNYEAPKLNQGKESIDDMSLIIGLYENFIVTKSGHLVGIISGSGINLDLLNEVEQEDVFNDFNAFLISNLGSELKEIHQYLDITKPVNMDSYIMNLKKRYLKELNSKNTNKFLLELTASYIDHYSNLQQKKGMTTKEHTLAVRVKIADKHEESLISAAKELSEKLEQLKKSLEESLNDFDLVSRILTAAEVRSILKNLINFKGKE